MDQNQFTNLSTIDRAEYVHGLNGDYELVLKQSLKGLSSRRDIDRYLFIRNQLSTKSKLRFKQFQFRKTKSAHYDLARYTAYKQNQIWDILDDPNKNAKTIREAIHILKNGRLQTHREREISKKMALLKSLDIAEIDHLLGRNIEMVLASLKRQGYNISQGDTLKSKI